MKLSNFIRLPTHLFRTKMSPVELSKSTRTETHMVTVILPIPKSEVELHPTLAYVLGLIMDSKDQGIRRPDQVITGLNMTNWNTCILLLRQEGALIDATMKEGLTKQGHMSSWIIHYIYRGWK